MEISVGSIVDGTVKSITKFGAFISLPGGRSGLVHISEIAHTYVNDVSDHLTDGQAVRVKVVGIDEMGRINLSIKKATEPPARPQSNNQPRGRTPNYTRAAPAPKDQPTDFEFRLKQFMQSSDSKLSDMRMLEKRSSRRSSHK